jgi:hypothetical protein
VQHDFRQVLKHSAPTVAARELVRYEEFTREFGSEGS